MCKESAKKVDFVATKGGKPRYFQVSYIMELTETLERELAPLQTIGDAYPRFILTYGRSNLGDFNGVQSLHLPDWLLDKVN
ncbi:MAG: hypothetical protein LBL67_01665 [Coriobacteriales bacterium]|nr:hypothetical protein [Coriobacteriales bacterium]